MSIEKLKDNFEFRMNPEDIVLPQEELFIYAAHKINEKNFIVYCKNSKKTKPNLHDVNTIEKNIELGYWKVIN